MYSPVLVQLPSTPEPVIFNIYTAATFLFFCPCSLLISIHHNSDKNNASAAILIIFLALYFTSECASPLHKLSYWRISPHNAPGLIIYQIKDYSRGRQPFRSGVVRQCYKVTLPYTTLVLIFGTGRNVYL